MFYDILSNIKVAWTMMFLLTLAAILYEKFSKKELFQKLFDTAFYYSQALTVILFVFPSFGIYSEHFRDFLPFIATCCGLLFLCFTIMSHLLNESGKRSQSIILILLAIFFLFDMITTLFL